MADFKAYDEIGQLLHLLPLGRPFRALYFPLFPAMLALKLLRFYTEV